MLARRVPLPVVAAKADGVLRGEAGRRLLLGKVEEKLEYEGDGGMLSYSVIARGVRSSSEFSDMVWSISRELLKLEKVSSEDLRSGLRWRLEGPSNGEEGRTTKLPLESGTGEEWARAICGADRVLCEERDRAWPRAYGDLVRGRKGRLGVALFKKGERVCGDSGAVARRGVSGRSRAFSCITDVFTNISCIGKLGSGFSAEISGMRGRGMSRVGTDTRGAIFAEVP